MSAEAQLKAGDLDAALAELQQQVRAAPGDAEKRVFLFQLLATIGNWDRALTQLDTINDLNTEAWPMVRAYREVVNCEKHREAVFAGKSKPLIFGTPEAWMAELIQAQQAFAKGDYDTFAELNAKALEEAPALAGKINDEPFEWLADADQRFGPVIEMVFNGHYYWVPVNNIRTLRTEAPSDLRDLIWLPAEVTWSNGGELMVMLPARYPVVEDTPAECLMSRKTDWREAGDGNVFGVGQKMLATDEKDYPLLEVRSIEFEA